MVWYNGIGVIHSFNRWIKGTFVPFNWHNFVSVFFQSWPTEVDGVSWSGHLVFNVIMEYWWQLSNSSVISIPSGATMSLKYATCRYILQASIWIIWWVVSVSYNIPSILFLLFFLRDLITSCYNLDLLFVHEINEVVHPDTLDVGRRRGWVG